MSYGEIIRVGASIEAYQAMHQQIGELLGGRVPEGAILHVARATDDGFEVIEVWESKEQADAFKREVFELAVERLGAAAAGAEPRFLEFEPTTTVTFGAYNSDTQG
jgi:hypothetical protein